MHAYIHLIFLFFEVFFFFKSSFNFTANWDEGTKISHILPSPTFAQPPPLSTSLSHCCFNLQFPNDIWYGTSFHMLICHLYIFFGELSVRVFGPFSFLIAVFKSSLYILDTNSLSDMSFFWKTNTIWYHLYVESKIWPKWICLRNRNRQTHRQREQTYDCQGGGRIGSSRLGDENYYV